MSEHVAPPIRLLAGLGRATLAFLGAGGRTLAFSTSSLTRALTSGAASRTTFTVTISLVVRCALPVTLVLAPLGGMLTLQSLTLMRTFGFERGLGVLIITTVTRELAPGFAALVVAMQGGAGIAAELGAMRVREELDAMEVMGVDARRVVTGPRILGTILAAPLLNLIAIATAMIGGYIVAVPLYGVSHTAFVDDTLHGFLLRDLVLSASKAAIFGFLVGGICATAGFYAGRGPAGVGHAAHRGVVISVVAVLVVNYCINTAILGLRGGGGML